MPEGVKIMNRYLIVINHTSLQNRLGKMLCSSTDFQKRLLDVAFRIKG